MLEKYFPNDWIETMGRTKLEETLTDISSKLVELRKIHPVLPTAGNPLLFQAFRETPLQLVKVVVVGLDIYHGQDEFNGLSFGNGAPNEYKTKGLSPSLRNILNEVERTEGSKPNPNLYSWARQGVLMINAAHSVVEGVPRLHLALWKPFTSLVFSALNTKNNLVWMLWGKDAQEFEAQITNTTHSILKAGHPSPLNSKRDFIGCNCFQDCNEILKSTNIQTITWT